MKKKSISSFAVAYIVIGLLGIIIMLYSTGTEIYQVTTENSLFAEKADELTRLETKKKELEKIVSIRSTKEYKDRFNKENHDIYNDGEIVLILPPEEKKKDEFEGLTAAQIKIELEKKRPIIDQWKRRFFNREEDE